MLQGAELPNPVDGSGYFTENITDFKGRYVKEADKDIIAVVKVRHFHFLSASHLR